MTMNDKLPVGQRAYVRVNATWPNPLPALTAQEAMSAGKRLYRLGMGRAFKGKIKVTSGRRHSWVRQGVLYVNPDRGWHHLVHDLSHYCFWRTHPNRRPHDWRHAAMEKRLIEAVVSGGWLNGKLRREPKPKPDLKTVRQQRIVARIKAWETKRKRAENALKKLYKQQTYYEKTLETGP
jgi:hypothetical protein